ncbi:MAG: hypothetical protein R2852_03965 [Bacteroidia bacterium]
MSGRITFNGKARGTIYQYSVNQKPINGNGAEFAHSIYMLMVAIPVYVNGQHRRQLRHHLLQNPLEVYCIKGCNWKDRKGNMTLFDSLPITSNYFR